MTKPSKPHVSELCNEQKLKTGNTGQIFKLIRVFACSTRHCLRFQTSRKHLSTKVTPYPRRLHIKFGFDRSSGFREYVWNCVNGRRTPEHVYTLSSPMRLRLSAKKQNNNNNNENQRNNGPVSLVNAQLISGLTISTKTSFAKFDIDL